MFGKIKGKLKNVFNKHDEIIEENINENINENIDENIDEKTNEIINEELQELDIPLPTIETPLTDIETEEKEIDEDSEEKNGETPKSKGFFSKIFKKNKKLEEPDEKIKNTEEQKTIKKETEQDNIDLPHIKKVNKLIEEITEKEKASSLNTKEIELPPKNKTEQDIQEIKKTKETTIPAPEKLQIIPKELEKITTPEEKIEKIEQSIEKPEPKITETTTKRTETKTEKQPKIIEKPSESETIEKDKKEESQGFISKTFQKLKSKKINEDDFDKIWVELEIFLLEINIAYEIVTKIEHHLREVLIGHSFDRFKLSEKIKEVLIEEVSIVLKEREDSFIDKINKLNNNGEIARMLVLGVNGTGKTTTIAKIVNVLQKHNLSVVVAAADTFRAAAVEQLDEHAHKLNFKLIKHKGGSDPAAVAFDAIEHAKAKKLNIVIVDTAGRMPNNSNLMQELNKIQRVTKSQMNVFVGDSISGNDLIEQIDLFDKVVGITGIILTKTDTDERPGSIVTAAYSIEKPIYYLGIGQGYDDLVEFDADLIAHKLFEVDED